MKLYTANELANILQIHPRTVYRLGREGALKRVKVGRSVRFAEPKIERSSEDVKRGTKEKTAV